MIDWTQGYSSTFRVDRVSAATWESFGTLGGVASATVDRDGTDEAPLLESASLRAVSPALESFEAGWHRLVMLATQGTYSEAVPVATVWLEAGSGYFDKGYREDTLTGRSVLYQAADAPIGDGAYCPKGADGADWCASALRAVMDAPVSVAGSFTVADHIVFNLKSSVLQAVWAVLKSADWCIQIDGRGEVSILPLPDKPSISLDRDGACIVQPKVSYSGDGITYKREYMPGVHPFSLVYGALPERGMDGTYRVRTQKITCAKGITVEEAVA